MASEIYARRLVFQPARANLGGNDRSIEEPLPIAWCFSFEHVSRPLTRALVLHLRTHPGRRARHTDYYLRRPDILHIRVAPLGRTLCKIYRFLLDASAEACNRFPMVTHTRTHNVSRFTIETMCSFGPRAKVATVGQEPTNAGLPTCLKGGG